MVLPEKLLEKVLYWAPLFVGFVSLIGGVWVLQSNNSRLTNLKETVVVSGMKPLSKKNDFARKPNAVLKTKQEDPESDKVISLKQKPLLDQLETPKSSIAPVIPPDNSLQEGDKPLTKVMADVLRLRGGNAGSYGALVYEGTSKTGTQVVTVKREHQAFKIGQKAGRQGFLGQSGQWFVNSKGRQILLAELTAWWAVNTGKLGGVVQVAVIPGVDKSAVVPLRALVEDYSSHMGKQGVRLELGGQLGAALGQEFKINSQSNHYGLALARLGVLGKQAASRWAQALGQKFYTVNIAQGAGVKFALGTFEIKQGFERTHKNVLRLKLLHQGHKFGQRLNEHSVSYVSLGLKGLNTHIAKFAVGLKRDQNQKVALRAPLNDLPEQTKNCSETFYQAVQTVRTERVALLRKKVKPLFVRDKKLPGRWIFRPTSFKPKRACARWKTYRSGRKKCLRWGPRRAYVQTDYLSDNEKKVLLSAQTLVFNQGRDPALKRKTPNYWVINRIATDLNIYTRQPMHPAICTGAVRMVDYFEGNLGRVKKHIATMAQVYEQSASVIEARRQLLQKLLIKELPVEQDQAGLPLPRPQKADLEQALSHNNSLANQMTYVSTQAVIAPFKLNSLKSDLIALGTTLLGQEAGQEMAISEGFLGALKIAKSYYGKHGTVIDMDRGAVTAMKRLFGAMEARFYLERANRQLEGVSHHLLGALDSLRQAHLKHCVCE